MPLFIAPDFSAGELSPSIYGRVDTNEYRKGLKRARNAYILPFGGVTNRPGTIYCGPCKEHNQPPRLIKFQFKTTDSYIIEMGDQYFRFLRNGYHVVETPVAITSITSASPGVVTATAHGYSNGDHVFLAGMTGMVELQGRWVTVANVTANTFELTDQVTGDDIDTSTYEAYTSGGEVARVYEIATPYVYADIDEVKFVQSGDVITLVHPSYDPRNLSRTGHTSWSLTTISFVPDIAAPGSLTVTPQGTTGATTYNYRVTAVQDATFIEGPYSEAQTTTGNATLSATNYNQIDWSTVTGAFRYNVYKEEGGLYGFLATVETNTFNDTGAFAPNFDQSPREPIDPFTGASNDPAAVGFYQQRKVYGNTNNDPDSVWFSVTGDYNNFSRAYPSQLDDGFQVTLDQRQVNEIRHFLALDDLLVFTSGAEWAISAGTDTGFGLETLRQKPQSTWGCSHLEPLLIGRTVLFVQNLSSIIRSFGYTFEQDGFSGNNLTILARHLFLDRQIRDWAYAPIPNTIVHACRDDGIMLNLTFNQEQNVIAWSWSETKGMFHSVESIPNVSAGEDVTYVVTKRFLNGNDVCFIERFHTRAWPDIRDNHFVDAGLIMDGPVAIEGMSIDDTTGIITITITGHNFADGDEIELSDIIWEPDVDQWGDETQPYPHLNNGRFIVGDGTANTFVLYDVDDPTSTFDGSDLNGYVGSGYVRCCVDRIYGLHHLVGETVKILGDGKTLRDYVVSPAGSITFDDAKYARLHVGLSYLTDIWLLDYEPPSGGTVQARQQRVPSVTLRLEGTVGGWVGPDKDTLTEAKWRTDEVMFDPDAPFTGDKHIVFQGRWAKSNGVFIRQAEPLPLTLAAVIPDLAVSPPQITG